MCLTPSSGLSIDSAAATARCRQQGERGGGGGGGGGGIEPSTGSTPRIRYIEAIESLDMFDIELGPKKLASILYWVGHLLGPWIVLHCILYCILLQNPCNLWRNLCPMYRSTL